ncbi:MAG: hypothetical protein KAS11_04255 [Candidatus Aenigmarchaeota archaeon]|nr:hypothetical protein [Candidatus Aenigmarchaeota archaeon]MCK5043195.1 hypothetical protein [Candidatus Aenigmarchaeota archaeon]
MSKISAEMCMVKNELRRSGLPTRGVLAQEYRKMNFDQEKRWYQIKTRAHKRVEELAKAFPFAFGEHKKYKYDAEFIEQLTRKGVMA